MSDFKKLLGVHSSETRNPFGVSLYTNLLEVLKIIIIPAFPLSTCLFYVVKREEKLKTISFGMFVFLRKI